MAAFVKGLEWPALGAAGSSTGTARLSRTGRLMVHLLGWPLLVKVGLLTGFALAAAVQHLLAV